MKDAPRLVHPAQPLTADGIVLRPWRVTDVEQAHRGMQDPEVPRWTRIPAGNPLHEVRRYFDGQALAMRDGAEVVFAIATVDDEDRFLGSCSLLRPDWEQSRSELGYWLAPWGRGRGAMTVAVRLLSAFAFETTELARLELHISADNGPSQAVAQRAGFTFEGVLRSYETHGPDERIDVALWSLLRDDPR